VQSEWYVDVTFATREKMLPFSHLLIVSASSQISLLHPLNEGEEQEVVNGDPTDDSSPEGDVACTKADDRKGIIAERAGELVSLLNGFAFALQYVR
jgi:hypothetical protein